MWGPLSGSRSNDGTLGATRVHVALLVGGSGVNEPVEDLLLIRIRMSHRFGMPLDPYNPGVAGSFNTF